MKIILKNSSLVFSTMTPRELDSITKAMLSKYTRFDSDSEVAYALDDLVLEMKTLGIMNNLTFMHAPALSNDISEAVYDYANSVALTSDTTNLTFDEGKLSGSADGSTKATINQTTLGITIAFGTAVFDGTFSGTNVGFCLTKDNCWINNTYNAKDATIYKTSHIIEPLIAQVTAISPATMTLNNLSPDTDMSVTAGETLATYYLHNSIVDNTGYNQGIVMHFNGNKELTSDQITELRTKVAALKTALGL